MLIGDKMGEKKLLRDEPVQLHEIVGKEGEFKPGDGIRVRNGKLIAHQIGRLVIDTETKEISVWPVVSGG